MLLLLYIDNIRLAYGLTAAKVALELKLAFAATYKITNLRTPWKFLGIKINYETDVLIPIRYIVFIYSILK